MKFCIYLVNLKFDKKLKHAYYVNYCEGKSILEEG